VVVDRCGRHTVGVSILLKLRGHLHPPIDLSIRPVQ
jgi:hypothetical protein